MITKARFCMLRPRSSFVTASMQQACRLHLDCMWTAKRLHVRLGESDRDDNVLLG